MRELISRLLFNCKLSSANGGENILFHLSDWPQDNCRNVSGPTSFRQENGSDLKPPKDKNDFGYFKKARFRISRIGTS